MNDIVTQVDVAGGYADGWEMLEELEREMLARVRGEAQAGRLAATRRARMAASALPWPRLMRAWGLEELEEDLVALLVCVREDPSFRAEAGLGSSMASLLGALVSPGRLLRSRHLLARDAPLVRQGIVLVETSGGDGSILDAYVSVPAQVAAMLLDDRASFSHMRLGIRVHHPEERLSDVVLPEGVEQLLRGVIHAPAPPGEGVRYGRGTILLLEGPPGTGKTLTARALAGEAKKPLIMLDLAAVQRGRRLSYGELLRLAIDEARLADGILLVDEFDMFLEGSMLDDVLTLLETAESTVVLASSNPIMPHAMDRRIQHRIRYLPPTVDERRRIWRILAPADTQEEVIGQLSRIPLTGGYIKNAVMDHRPLVEAADIQRARMCEELESFYQCPVTGTPPAEPPPPMVDTLLGHFEALESPDVQRARRIVGDRGLRIFLSTPSVKQGSLIARHMAHALGVPVMGITTNALDEFYNRDSALRTRLRPWAGRCLVSGHVVESLMDNQRLAQTIRHILRPQGHHVILHGQLPASVMRELAPLFHHVIPLPPGPPCDLGRVAILLGKAGIEVQPDAGDLLAGTRTLDGEVQDAIFLAIVQAAGGKMVTAEVVKRMLEARLIRGERTVLFGEK